MRCLALLVAFCCSALVVGFVVAPAGRRCSSRTTMLAAPRGIKKGEGRGAALVRRYFDLWNERRMAEAVELFTEQCSYEDTLYSGRFEGRAALRKHLFRVADALPDSFEFVVDEIADGGGESGTVGVQWHVESDGKPLPFTRGSSMYKVDARSGKISYGFDVPEPTVKSGSFSLAILTVAGKLIDSPIRAVPLAACAFYYWFVFLSNVAPGPNALSLDPATWAEVKDLSLNFWLLMPLATPSAAPVLHPMLEGLFNFLLSWAALFSGFIIDGKRQAIGDRALEAEAAEGEQNAFVPYVLGMQLLTNAIYLPYLVLRKPWFPDTTTTTSSSSSSPVTLTKGEKFGESKLAPLTFLGVGLLSLWWAVAGRPDFGDLAARWASFVEIVGTDRLTFSFVVDCLYFAAFQGWLVDDDAKRRGMQPGAGAGAGASAAVAAAKFVPFFGLAYYLLVRPPLPGLVEKEKGGES